MLGVTAYAEIKTQLNKFVQNAEETINGFPQQEKGTAQNVF
jgi:hypothetical protein